MTKPKNPLKLHSPVLVHEVIEALRLEKIAHLKRHPRFIDATLGLGGHTLAIIRQGGEVLGIEADPEMLEVAKRRLEVCLEESKEACPPPHQTLVWGSYKLVYGNFKNIDSLAKEAGFDRVEGILFDLGVSFGQLTSAIRGFSFASPKARLDMRIDKSSQAVGASDLVNSLGKKQLVSLFQVVLDKAEAVRISEAIVEARAHSPIESVGDFLEIIGGLKLRRTKLHSSTRPFLALRIAVNSEIPNLEEALPKAFSLLSVGGRLVVISFHSKEDRLVKAFFRKMSKGGWAKGIGSKPITAGREEIKVNPRARSARMRILEKNEKSRHL